MGNVSPATGIPPGASPDFLSGFFLMAADNSKRQNCVKVCFTDREFIDLGRIAARDNRKVADLVWVEMRRRMYGTIGAETQTEEGTEGDE